MEVVWNDFQEISLALHGRNLKFYRFSFVLLYDRLLYFINNIFRPFFLNFSNLTRKRIGHKRIIIIIIIIYVMKE